MEIKFIAQEEIILYSKKILKLEQGENLLDLGSQDIENYRKEIETRKLNIEIKTPEKKEDGEDVSKDKGNKQKPSKKSADKQ